METFEIWMEKVDSAIQQLAGCFAADLPNFDYRLMYDEGYSAYETARSALTGR